MASVTVQRSASELAELLLPRDDALVAERLVSRDTEATRFEGVHGPFQSWSRTVSPNGSSPAHDEVSERIEYRLALGPWSVLFAPLVRRQVRSGVRRDESPWWSPPDRLDPRAAGAIAAGASFAVIGGFLAGMLSQTLTFIGGEFGAGVATQSAVQSVVRVGALATFLGMWLADRRGRKPLIIGSFLLAAVATALTGIAPSLLIVTVLQTVSRSTAVIGVLLLPVIAAEELPAGSRAYATGVLAMAGGLGVGIVIVLLPLSDLGPSAWRILYGLAIFTIPATLAVGRWLPETRRFMALAAEPPTQHARLQPTRLLLMGMALLLINLFVSPVSQLQNEFLHDARGFSASRITLFILITNALGGAGVVIGGELADRRSRHLVATIGLLGLSVGNAAMYASTGWPMWAWSTVGSALGAFVIPSIGVLNPELFPTARRGGASGALNIAAVVGAVIGLLGAGLLIDKWGYGPTFALLAVAPVLVIGLLRALPETARMRLEDINPGDVGEFGDVGQ